VSGWACADAEAVNEAAPGLDPLPGSVATLDELGQRVLGALTLEDLTTLEGVRLTEREHNEVVWPELPASAPEVNFPVDYAWTNIQNRNRRSLGRIVPLYAGRELRFQLVDCRGETQLFGTFEVLADCWIVFASEGSSHVYEAQIFKDVLVRGGGHKIFRYYDEEPRRVSPDEAVAGRRPRPGGDRGSSETYVTGVP
jgi:hypothetical protein